MAILPNQRRSRQCYCCRWACRLQAFRLAATVGNAVVECFDKRGEVE
ncbi:MAG: hypothetical protein HYS12_03870 [Planctomycetes bacterium]|nr:hypothetical protein [Planctomycetota bacterium]